MNPRQRLPRYAEGRRPCIKTVSAQHGAQSSQGSQPTDCTFIHSLEGGVADLAALSEPTSAAGGWALFITWGVTFFSLLRKTPPRFLREPACVREESNHVEPVVLHQWWSLHSKIILLIKKHLLVYFLSCAVSPIVGNEWIITYHIILFCSLQNKSQTFSLPMYVHIDASEMETTHYSAIKAWYDPLLRLGLPFEKLWFEGEAVASTASPKNTKTKTFTNCVRWSLTPIFIHFPP